MIGAIIGDIFGSRFEFVEDAYHGTDFALFASGYRFTDDSLMTLAVAKALLLSKGNYDNLGELTVRTMKDIAKEDCELEAFQETQFRRDGYVFSKQMIEKLLKTGNILNSYLRSFILTKKEWEEWNGGIVYYKSNKGRERCEELEHVPTVSASSNLLLNYLLPKVSKKKYTQSYLQGVKYMESHIHIRLMVKVE